MREASPTLEAYLASTDSLVITDLYTFALPSGAVLRYSGSAAALKIPGTAFPSNSLNYNATGYTEFALGPRFGRSTVTTKIGVEATELDVSVMAGAGDRIGSFSFAEAVRVGELDGATVELDRLFGAGGAIVWFYGRVAETDAGRTNIAIKVKSLMNLLAEQQMPRRLYQAACTHVFGDAMCTFDRTSRAVTQAALAGSNQAQIVTALVPSPAALFDQGTIAGLTGANAGQSRTIARLSAGTVFLLKAWLYPVAEGDTFSLLPGCDHTTATCSGTFGNLDHFGGFPYIPPPELAV